MTRSPRATAVNLFRLLGVAVLALVVSVAGHQASEVSAVDRSRASLDADASGTLDFADIARELNGTLGASFIRFYVDALDRANRDDLALPTPHEVASGTVHTAALTSRDRDHDETPSVGSAYTLPDLAPLPAPRGRIVAVTRSACCEKSERGPPALA